MNVSMHVNFHFFTEFTEKEGDSHNEEDDENTTAIDNDCLCILCSISRIGPDCLLQVSHQGSSPSKSKN